MSVSPTRVGHVRTSDTAGGTKTTGIDGPNGDGTISLQVGDLIIAVLSGASGGTAVSWSANPTVVSGPAVISWSLIHQGGSDASRSVIRTLQGIVTTAGTNVSFQQIAVNSTSSWTASFHVWRDHGGIGANAWSIPASGAATQTLTTLADNSAVVVNMDDWNAINNTGRTWATVNGSPMTEAFYNWTTGQHTQMQAYRLDAGAAGSKSLGVVSAAGQLSTFSMVEILPKPPTITNLYQVGSSAITNAGTGKTSSAFTPPANSKLTIVAFGESSSGVATFTPTDSVGLSWAQVDHSQTALGFFPRITVWEASIGGSPVSMTVTITPTVWNSEIAYAVYAVTGGQRKSGQDVAATSQAGATYQSGTLPATAQPGNLSVFILGINTDAFITPPTPSGWTNLAKIAAGGGTYEKIGVSYRTDFNATSANVASTSENLGWGVALIEYESVTTAPNLDFGYGEWLLEDGSGGWQLEDGSGTWLLDTTESAPVTPVARVRGPIISNVALNRSHTR